MSKPDGRRKRAIEGLAAALQECFDAAVEKSTEAAETAERVARQTREELGARMDKQDDTLRMIWTQCGGRKDARLPIDRE